MKTTQPVTFEIDMEDVGKKFAHACHDEQADFFNALAEGFEEFSNGDLDGRQMFSIIDALDDRSKAFIQKFADYIAYDGKDKTNATPETQP